MQQILRLGLQTYKLYRITLTVINCNKAGEWYNERHVNMTNKYGIDAFKFDAGEVVWFPG